MRVLDFRSTSTSTIADYVAEISKPRCWSIGPIGLPLVEDLFAFHQRKGEERDFPQGNAEGRDSGARESWLEDERASWVICVFVGRLDFLYNIVFPICCPVGSVAFGFFGEVFEEFREWEFQTRTTASTR